MRYITSEKGISGGCKNLGIISLHRTTHNGPINIVSESYTNPTMSIAKLTPVTCMTSEGETYTLSKLSTFSGVVPGYEFPTKAGGYVDIN